MNGGIDARTPVIVGVGQASERIDDRHYRGMSAVDLGAQAVAAALADAGDSDGRIVSAIDTVAAIRQFENSVPGLAAPLGRSNNYPRSVAQRIGASPARAILEVAGGHGPQHLVTELAGAVAEGSGEVVVVVGADAISTARHLVSAVSQPNFSETIDGDLDDRGLGSEALMSQAAIDHGLTDAASQFALMENARRARLGLTREEHADGMGRLLAPFTTVAAQNPHAAVRTHRTATDLMEPSERNRPISEPYLRFVVARDQVNQGAAVLVMSVGAAQRLGVPQDKWVFVHGHADLQDRSLLEREDLGESPAAVMASRHALEVAGIAATDLSTLDLYSCFPVAVSNVAEGLGIADGDPRGLTVTGGLPFFGGPGNNYSMHAIVETAARCRRTPGSFGFVGANGGMLSKYSVGVYSTTPVRWRRDRSADIQRDLDSKPGIALVDRAQGTGTVETYTVRFDKDHTRSGIVVGRMDVTGERFVACTETNDLDAIELMTRGEPLAARVAVRSSPLGNRVVFESTTL